MAIIWNPTLETGIRQVDLQHQELIEIINELEAAHESGQDAVALDQVLPRLTAYILFHFNDEEAITANVAAGTTHAEKHIAEHRKFTDIIERFKSDRTGDTTQAVTNLVNYLQKWLVNHIMVTDKELASIFRKHGMRR